MDKKIDMEKIAALSKLRYDAKEMAALEDDFEAILAFAGELPILEDGESMSGAIRLDELRDDAVAAGVPRDALLEQAPASFKGCISVPKVIEG